MRPRRLSTSTIRATRAFLKKFDIQLSRWSKSYPFFRTRLFQEFGVGLVLDVGANRGQYAEELRKEGYKGVIHSFEPGSRAFSELQRKTQLDPLWECFNVGLAESSGELPLKISENSVSSSFAQILPAHLAITEAARVVREEGARVERLDDLYASDQGPKGGIALKIDVQGFELEVLRGGTRLLRSCDIVEVELCLVPLYEGQPLMEDITGYLRSVGFDPVHFEATFLDPLTSKVIALNGLFVPR